MSEVIQRNVVPGSERDGRNTSYDESRDNWTKYTGLPRLWPGGALGQPAVMTVAAVLHCSLYYSRNHRMEQCEESPLRHSD